MTFDTTIEKTTPDTNVDIHEIEPPVESTESLFEPAKPAELVIDRATPIVEEVEEYKEFEKEEVATRKRRSTIESRENATEDYINRIV